MVSFFVVEKFMEARPVATTMAVAREVVPGLHENMLLHAGPPVTWERMSGPMRGAMIGALIFEGKAKTGEEAEKMLASGKIAARESTVVVLTGTGLKSTPRYAELLGVQV